MERLTKSDLVNGCPVCYPKSDSGLPELVMKSNPYRKIIEKLKEYEDLEEQRKLLKLPCAVGDAVWFIKSNFSYMQNPKAEKIRKVEIIDGEIIFRTENRCFEMKYIGKIVFLTREEAEAALKRMEV